MHISAYSCAINKYRNSAWSFLDERQETQELEATTPQHRSAHHLYDTSNCTGWQLFSHLIGIRGYVAYSGEHLQPV